jgi:hypothetical protein
MSNNPQPPSPERPAWSDAEFKQQLRKAADYTAIVIILLAVALFALGWYELATAHWGNFD